MCTLLYFTYVCINLHVIISVAVISYNNTIVCLPMQHSFKQHKFLILVDCYYIQCYQLVLQGKVYINTYVATVQLISKLTLACAEHACVLQFLSCRTRLKRVRHATGCTRAIFRTLHASDICVLHASQTLCVARESLFSCAARESLQS